MLLLGSICVIKSKLVKEMVRKPSSQHPGLGTDLREHRVSVLNPPSPAAPVCSAELEAYVYCFGKKYMPVEPILFRNRDVFEEVSAGVASASVWFGVVESSEHVI